jgi:TetR/AcrR family transcriptional regulator, transcriptional repressor for nem operon
MHNPMGSSFSLVLFGAVWRLRRKDDLQHPIGVRYSPEHKLETHRKIVKDASRRVRAEGLGGAAVSAVMKDAGLTHGGFYKHFGSKDDLLLESLREGFREIKDTLAHAAKASPPEEAWKAIVKAYLSLELCEHPEHGCPLAALSPELARADKNIKPQIVAELVNYKSAMLPFMPGQRTADKERAFFVIFSTMIGAVEIARILPDRAIREKVLAGTREFLLHSF